MQSEHTEDQLVSPGHRVDAKRHECLSKSDDYAGLYCLHDRPLIAHLRDMRVFLSR